MGEPYTLSAWREQRIERAAKALGTGLDVSRPDIRVTTVARSVVETVLAAADEGMLIIPAYEDFDAPMVERAMWGIHASRGLGSPRQVWAEMPVAAREQLKREAEGAISVFVAALVAREQQEGR